MDIKVIVTQDVDIDGVDSVMTLEHKDVGDTVSDSLRFYLEAMTAMGFTYIENLQANSRSGRSWNSDDLT